MGCEGITRVVLVVLNIIFFLIGGTALGLGIWSIVDNTYLIRLTNYAPDVSSSVNIPSLLQNAAYILIAAGAFIFIISFAGCCGAWKKIKFLLIVYAVLVGLVLLLEIAAVVVAYFFLDQVENNLKSFLKDTITKKYDSSLKPNGAGSQFTYVVGDDNTYSLAWDFVQVQFQCCGVTNGSDYATTTAWNKTIDYVSFNGGSSLSTNLTYAVTCCAFENANNIVEALNAAQDATLKLSNVSCPISPVGDFKHSGTGCLTAIKSAISKYSVPLIAVGASVLAIELLLIIMAACVVRCIKSSEELA